MDQVTQHSLETNLKVILIEPANLGDWPVFASYSMPKDFCSLTTSWAERWADRTEQPYMLTYY